MEDRRTLIADSAIEVVARDGVRALTHRAVDAEAGLAAGSTSYYCRTRSQLLSLTVERLSALLRGFVEQSGIQQLRPADPQQLGEALYSMEAGLLESYQAELVSRSALIVELGRESAGEDSGAATTVSTELAELRASLLDPADIEGALVAAGFTHPQAAAADLLTVFEGLLWERTVGREAGGPPDQSRDLPLFVAALSHHEHRLTGRGLFGLRR